jgi:hypothetical protein
MSVAERLGRGAAQRAPAPDPINAPLFRSLMERMDDGERWVVLDFGPAQTELIALLGRNRCRLDIADVADGLQELNAEPDPKLLLEKAERLLPARGEDPTDLVLCWDLLNYLERPALAALMHRIKARTRPTTITHALIVYSAQRMPVRPGRYVPQEDQRLVNVGASQQQRDAPRYSPEDLAQCMPDYVPERGMLLRNGMQEFLFRFSPHR